MAKTRKLRPSQKPKLKWKIFGFLVGFSALLLAILWVFQTFLLNDMYKVIRRGEVEKAVEVVAQNIDSPNLPSVLKRLETDKEILVRPTGSFMAPMQQPPPMQPHKPPPESITKTQIFTLASGEKTSLTFFAMITPVAATVSTLQTQLYVITGIMLLLSIIMALVIAKIVARPIEGINDSAKILAAGSYNTHFSGTGYLEIEELSATLNTAAAELAKVETLRRELMANVSHDLRTPLALIYSNAEVMHDFPDEVTPAQTQTIMDETLRLSSLVNDIMDISKFETGNMQLICTSYNLTRSIAQTVHRMAELLRKDGYVFSFTYQEEVQVTADAGKITQAVYNLLTNAVNYSGSDKTVKVEQRLVGPAVTVAVIDTGGGVLPENAPYIWDRYYKVDKSHKRAVTGTGLGLSIVKQIVELHGGRYGVQSTPGQGSEFWFTVNVNGPGLRAVSNTPAHPTPNPISLNQHGVGDADAVGGADAVGPAGNKEAAENSISLNQHGVGDVVGPAGNKEAAENSISFNQHAVAAVGQEEMINAENHRE